MKKIIICLIMALLFAGGVEAKTPRKTKRSKQRTTRTTPKRKAPTPISEPRYDMNIDGITDKLTKQQYQRILDGTASADDYCAIGAFYAAGRDGFPEDDAEALRYYYLAAKAGNGRACSMVGDAYDEPSLFANNAVEENNFEAAKWYARASALGEDCDVSLGSLLKYGEITNEEFRIANELAGNDVEEAKNNANAAYNDFRRNSGANNTTNNQRQYFYGTWRSGGATFTITPGPYLNFHGVGRFSGEWRSNGELHVSFGYPDEINLRYSNGYLYNRDGRRYWKVN